MARSVFEGIKILDMGTAMTVPLALKWMADHGAIVIKIESHVSIDLARMGGPHYELVVGPDRAGWQMCADASKYSMTLNLHKPGAREVVKRLLTEWRPHIMAESFRPGVMKEWGLDYQSVRELRPDIIYWSTCLEGQYGPHSQRLGYGTVSTNLAGVSHLTGWPDRGPAGQFLAYADTPACGTGLLALVAALLRQKKMGKGVYIDQAQYEANLYVLAGTLMEYLVNGRVVGRSGNRLPYAAPHGVYPCMGDDRWVAIAVFTDEEWESFCHVIGAPEWTKDPKFATFLARKSNEDELDRLVGEWTKNYAAEEVETMMQANGVAANVVETNKDIYEDPQLKHYGHFRELSHPEVGTVRSEIPTFKLPKCPDTHFRAPLLGEHNHYVLAEILGMSDDEIADLYADRAITTEADLPGASQ